MNGLQGQLRIVHDHWYLANVDVAAIDAKQGEKWEEEEVAQEIGVVLLPNTIAHPGTVVVKSAQNTFYLQEVVKGTVSPD